MATAGGSVCGATPQEKDESRDGGGSRKGEVQ